MTANQDPSQLFRVLAVRSRLRILELLKAQGPIGSNRIARILGITPAAVSQHLRLMQQVGLVIPQRRGYWIPYAIDEKTLEKYRHIVNCICTCQGFTPGENKKTTSEYNSAENSSTKQPESSPGNSELEGLRNYRQRLEAELKLIEQRIKDLEK